MYISDFEYHQPKTVAEACRLLESNPDGAILAGGTDLLVDLKQGKRHHPSIISITDIPDLQAVELSGDKIFIGACVTHNGLADSPVLRQHCPAIGRGGGDYRHGTDPKYRYRRRKPLYGRFLRGHRSHAHRARCGGATHMYAE